MKSFWKITFTVLITGAIVGGSTYYYINSKAKQDKNELQAQIDDLNVKLTTTEQSLTDAQTAATVAGETADWKTYTNSRYGYSIKYPENWHVNSTSSEEDFSKRGSEDTGGIKYIGGDTYWSNYAKFDYALDEVPSDQQLVSMLIRKTDLSLDDYFNSTYNNSNLETSNKRSATISGKSVIRFIATSIADQPVGLKTSFALIKLDNSIMVFNYSANSINDMTDTFSTMVSSITFTN